MIGRVRGIGDNFLRALIAKPNPSSANGSCWGACHLFLVGEAFRPVSFTSTAQDWEINFVFRYHRQFPLPWRRARKGSSSTGKGGGEESSNDHAMKQD
jgi:hypothetical protein